MTAALEGGEWSAAGLGRTLPLGKTRYPLYRRLGGPQGRFGRAENLVPTGIRSRTVQPVVSRYTDWATRPTYTIRYKLQRQGTCNLSSLTPTYGLCIRVPLDAWINVCYFVLSSPLQVGLRWADCPSKKSHQIAKRKLEPREKKEWCNSKYNGLICTTAPQNLPRV